MLKEGSYVAAFAVPVALLGMLALQYHLPLGPVVLSLTIIPALGLLLASRSLITALPDIIFGALDTGLLTLPALWGGMMFGVAGAIAGGVIGDALTDSVAGFFEGSIAAWLRSRGIAESREPITTGLGKMLGCLLGSGVILSAAFLVGIEPEFA